MGCGGLFVFVGLFSYIYMSYKPLPMRSYLFFLIVGMCCFVGCVREETDSGQYSSVNFSLEDARTYYEALALTRSAEQSEAYNTLYSGNKAPLWSSGVVSPGIVVSAAETGIDCEKLYGVVVGTEDGKAVLISLTPRLSVVHDETAGKKSAYLKFYLPTIDCTNGEQTSIRPEAAAGFATRFSGIVFYTTLSGFPVAVAEFVDGKIQIYAWLNDDRYTFEENWARMRKLGGDMRIALLKDTATRGVNDDNKIPSVEIVGIRPVKPPTLSFDSLVIPWDGPDLPDVEPRSDGFGGGGSSGSGSVVSINPNLVATDSEVERMVDSLALDCMGRRLIESIDRKIEIRVVPGDGCRYHRTTNGEKILEESIEIGKDAPVVGLAEELIHAYQNRNLYWKSNRALNNEIEAKIGWVLYLRRIGENLDDYAEYLGNRHGVFAFEIFCEAYDWDVISLSEPGNMVFMDVYYGIKDALRMPGSPYANPVQYPFLDSSANFANLVELMADC